MKGYQPIMTFDEANAGIYDDLARRGDEEATVEFLDRLAGGGPALELAIGTGRIALPLAARGVRVDGIDFSPAMVARLRAKDGGDQIPVTIGDFAEVGVSSTYKLIYIVFNSLFNLLTQHEQVRCFENVAAHLTDDGVFVVEGGCTAAFINDLTSGQYVRAEAIGVDAVRLDLLRLDSATQMLYENHVSVSQNGVRFNPVVQRYAWPTELDLMARIAGLRLMQRWGTWTRDAFTSSSTNVISVYER
jgi:SAM-dependent methyltransferase